MLAANKRLGALLGPTHSKVVCSLTLTSSQRCADLQVETASGPKTAAQLLQREGQPDFKPGHFTSVEHWNRKTKVFCLLEVPVWLLGLITPDSRALEGNEGYPCEGALVGGGSHKEATRTTETNPFRGIDF